MAQEFDLGFLGLNGAIDAEVAQALLSGKNDITKILASARYLTDKKTARFYIPQPKTTPLESLMKDLEREIHYSRNGVGVLIGAVFLIIAMLLQAALENEKYTPLSPTMRMEMKRAKDYLSDYHYLNDNRIQTTDQLKTALSDIKDKIAALEVERQSIRNKIRRATSEEKTKLKENAKAVTAKITPLRTRLKRLQRIYDKSDYVYKMIETEQKLERRTARNRERSR